MQKDGTRASSLEFGFDFVIVSLSPFLNLWPWAIRLPSGCRRRQGKQTRLASPSLVNSTAQMHRPRAANDGLVWRSGNVSRLSLSLPIPQISLEACLAQLVFCMTQGARGGTTCWAQSVAKPPFIGQICRATGDALNTATLPSPVLPVTSSFSSPHQSTGHRSPWRFRGRSQPGWEPDVVNSREKFSSSRVGERRRKLLMRVSTFGALKSPKTSKRNAW